MLTVSLLASVSLDGLTNGRVGLSPDFFSLARVGSGPFVRFLFKPFALLLVLDFIIRVRKHIAINIYVSQLVDCSGAG